MTLLPHTLVIERFRQHSDGCHLPTQSTELAASVAVRAIAARHDAWKADLPADDGEFWDCLTTALDEASRRALLAHRLAGVVGHEMVEGG